MTAGETTTALPVRQPGAGARLVEWKPRPASSSSLLGHATVDFTGWLVHRVPIFRRGDGSLSAGTPSAPELDGEGRQRERDGKRQYWPVLTFANTEAKQRWERAVLAALDAGGIVP